jgi:tRNA pseudouridine synthase 10
VLLKEVQQEVISDYMELIKKAVEILKNKYVCDHCIGRQYSSLLTGTTNKERGRIIRNFLAMKIDAGEKITINNSNLYGIKFRNEKIKPKKPTKCSICGDIFKEIKKKVKPILKELKKYEFETFLVGSKPPDNILNKEQELWDKVGIEWTESIRTEINREIGKVIEKQTGKKLNRRKPDITILYDFKTDSIKLDVRSIFVYGKYQKLVRNMPQCRWKTRIYKSSVQSVVAKRVVKHTNAEDT